MTERKISRREFLIIAISTSAGIFIPSCSEKYSTGSSFEEVAKFYPELSDFPVYTEGAFYTNRTKTRWLNLTKSKFDPIKASQTYQFFENLAARKLTIDYFLNAKNYPFSSVPRPKNERVLFIIPQDAPTPKWPGIEIARGRDAATSKLKEGASPYVSFVRIRGSFEDLPPSGMFINSESYINLALGVEACQSSLEMLPSNPNLSPIIKQVAQEFVCNSLGATFTIKQMGISYERYSKWADNVTVGPNPLQTLRILKLTREQFEELPMVGFAIKP